MRTEDVITPEAQPPAADRPALLQLGIAHSDARIDREDGRTARGRLQRQALAAGHLAPRPGVRHQLVITKLGRVVLERAEMMRQYRDHPGRFLRNHADDAVVRQALEEGTLAAIAAAIIRIRYSEAVALKRLRALLRP